MDAIKALNKQLYKTPDRINITKQYIKLGYLVVPLAYPIVLLSNYLGWGIYYDNLASLSLAFFLIAEFKLMTFKYDLSKTASRDHNHQQNVFFEKMLTADDKEKEELRETVKYLNEFREEDFSVNGYENVDMYDKASKSTEKYIIVGIFLSTVIWGFAGLLKALTQS